ncbi:inositol 2-dehydrogenase [Ruegeria sp.]|uniref:inositol 2-dehydrogenase n=1 Tax=Ruegeria sp. TaxID=1879320 RepID=UPI00231B30B8|nr:inositol 2-dehydrogenase [Ruegeria sp.]MDA7966788.1 inositol 2-dehydrogenase [Ruegeria sp.]
MLKIGLLGAGRIGRVHAAAISAHPETELTAVSDAVNDAAASLASEFGARVQSSDEIIGDSTIHAVLIATPTDTHSDLIEAATQAGKAVLCEKPVDLNLERAKICQKTAGATGQPVMLGFNRRFDPNFQALKAAHDAGEVGKVELLSITSFDPAPPPVSYIKVSGGLFRDMMIHDFDMSNYLMGQMPVTISAVGTSVVDPEIGQAGDVDTAVVTMTYRDGSLAVIKNSRRAAYGYDQRVELLGSQGLLQAHNVLENSVVKSTADGVTGAKPTYFFLERYMSAYRAEWDAFIRAIQSGSDMPVTLADGVAALAMAEAATRSAQSGRPVAMEDIF